MLRVDPTGPLRLSVNYCILVIVVFGVFYLGPLLHHLSLTIYARKEARSSVIRKLHAEPHLAGSSPTV